MPYEFTAEEFSRFSDEVLKAEGDQATLTTLLADMSTTITGAIASDVANKQAVSDVTAENERLKAANMSLFLRIGEPVGAGDGKGGSGKGKEDDDKPLTTSDYMASYFEKLDKK